MIAHNTNLITLLAMEKEVMEICPAVEADLHCAGSRENPFFSSLLYQRTVAVRLGRKSSSYEVVKFMAL